MVTVTLDKTTTSPWEIMATVKTIFGSKAISSSLIGMLTLAVDWPDANLIDCDTAV